MRLAVALALALSGCANMPKYERLPYPISPSPTPIVQADAICEPRARGAGYRAEGETRAAQQSRYNEVTGYNCTTSGYRSGNSYDSTTNCAPQTAGGPANKLAAVGDAIAPLAANFDASNSVYASCMAEHGWQYRRVCVSNCK